MQFTPAQKAAILTWINANAPGQTDVAVTAILNAAEPVSNNIGYRRGVGMAEIAKKINGNELEGMSSLKHTRLQTLIILTNAAGGAFPELADQRAFWDGVFSGTDGTITRPALLALWKRTVTVLEKLLKASGVGSDADPMIFGTGVGGSSSEGLITVQQTSDIIGGL